MLLCKTDPRSSVKAGGLFSNMTDFHGCRHLEFSIWLLISRHKIVPSWIWKTIESIVLKTITYCLSWLLFGYCSFERPILLRLSHLWIVAYFALHQNTITFERLLLDLKSFAAVRYLFVMQCCHPILRGFPSDSVGSTSRLQLSQMKITQIKQLLFRVPNSRPPSLCEHVTFSDTPFCHPKNPMMPQNSPPPPGNNNRSPMTAVIINLESHHL